MSDSKKYSSKLASKRVLVIGGSSGIGYSAAEAAVEYGAEVIISSSQQSRVDAAVSKIQNAYPSSKSQIRGFATDLSKDDIEEQIIKLFENATSSKSKPLDHVILTAANKLQPLPLQDVNLEYIRKIGHMRYASPVLVAKHAATYLKPSRESSLTFTTGSVAERPFPNWGVITGYVAGLAGLMRNLALDIKPIRVNIVQPGAVETPLWDDMPKENFEAFRESMKKSMTTGQIGSPEDVAEAYLYVMKDNNVSGAVVQTNGGGLVTS